MAQRARRSSSVFKLGGDSETSMLCPMKRRTFLVAAAGGLLLSRSARGARSNPAAPIVSAQARVMVSGGLITTEAGFLPVIQAAQRSFYPSGQPILMVLNASLPEERDAAEKRLANFFARNGFAAESLHHDSGAAARRRLNAAAAVFVGGGETFLLLRDLQDSGLLGLLRERVLAGLPYHGTSAGANLAGPVIGCTNDFPVVDLASRTALGVFPAVMNPHHPPLHDPEYAARAAKIQRYRRINTADTVLGLTNAAVAVLQQRQVRLTVGTGFLYGPTSRPLAVGPIAELSRPLAL